MEEIKCSICGDLIKYMCHTCRTDDNVVYIVCQDCIGLVRSSCKNSKHTMIETPYLSVHGFNALVDDAKKRRAKKCRKLLR